MGIPPITHDVRHIPQRCDRCGGVGGVPSTLDPREVMPCDACLSAGWVWSGDLRPPTLCPGGGANPIHANPATLPCGRSGRTCPGCDRDTDVIGGPEDIEATKAAVRGGRRRTPS